MVFGLFGIGGDSNKQDNQQQRKLRNAPVLVTGADGFMAGVLVRELLQAGCTVHATIFTSTTSQVQHLQDIADEYSANGAKIRFFTANLLEPGAFGEAMQGCRVVIHTASPFWFNPYDSKDGRLDPQRDLIDPAVLGTANVLETAAQVDTVERVVHTSSVGAIYGDAVDTYAAEGHVLTEDVWNTTSTLHHQAYFYSKTQAERKAWEIAHRPETNWTLVVLNPALILGPGLRYHPNSESFKTIQKLGGFHFFMLSGCPNFAMPIVDVRDVAVAHVKAAGLMPVSNNNKNEDNIETNGLVPSGRYILCARNSNFGEVTAWLRDKFPEYPVPLHTSWIPKQIAALVVPFTRQGFDAATVLRNVDVKVNLDNTKSKTVLGMTYRDPAGTVQAMFQQMIDAGAVQPGPRPELVGHGLIVAAVSIAVGIYWQFMMV